jgi:hypothetical protein
MLLQQLGHIVQVRGIAGELPNLSSMASHERFECLATATLVWANQRNRQCIVTERIRILIIDIR